MVGYSRLIGAEKAGESLVSSFSHLGKAVSILYAVIFLGESISPISLLCFALILTGTVVATKEESRSSLRKS